MSKSVEKTPLKSAPWLPGQVRSRYEGLRKARLDGFMDGFNAISLKLKEMYQMITLGGDAELELVDTLDPFSEVRQFSELLIPRENMTFKLSSCTLYSRGGSQGVILVKVAMLVVRAQWSSSQWEDMQLLETLECLEQGGS